jgi:hypothetical protein
MPITPRTAHARGWSDGRRNKSFRREYEFWSSDHQRAYEEGRRLAAAALATGAKPKRRLDLWDYPTTVMLSMRTEQTLTQRRLPYAEPSHPICNVADWGSASSLPDLRTSRARRMYLRRGMPSVPTRV